METDRAASRCLHFREVFKRPSTNVVKGTLHTSKAIYTVVRGCMLS